MKPAALLSLIAAMTCVAAPTLAEQPAAGAGYYASGDSEGFVSHRASVDGVIDYQHLDNKTGLRYTDYQFSKNGWSQRGEQLRFVANRIDRKTNEGWNLETGLFRQSTHELWTLDASYRQSLAGGPSVEVFANRDFVETQAALSQGTHFNFAGAAVDVPLHPQLTLVGLAGYQAFSDDNERRHLRARAIWQPALDLGLTLQLRYRWFDSSKADVGGAYFNPSRYQEALFVVGWRQRAGDWRMALNAGAGRQQIASDRGTLAQLLEASAEKQVGRYALRLRAGYSRSAAASATADPDYWYRYAVGELVVPF